MGTLRLYDTIIPKVGQFAVEEHCTINPMSAETTIQFNCKLAGDEAPLSTFLKVNPVLVLPSFYLLYSLP